MGLEPSPQDQRRRRSVEELELAYMIKGPDPALARDYPQVLKPFGFVNDQWEALKAMMEPGDELWEYRTAKESWDRGCGKAGIELMRDGKVIGGVITRMN